MLRATLGCLLASGLAGCTILASPEQPIGGSAGMTLIPIGEANALKGHVIHVPGAVVAVEAGKAYSPLAPDHPTVPPLPGTVIDLSGCPIAGSTVAVDFPLRQQEEVAAAVAYGPVGDIPKAAVVLARKVPASDHLLDAQLVPLHLYVFEGTQELAAATYEALAFPCAVILEDLAGYPGNEIAVVWASVAGGYTIGVTVFALKDNPQVRLRD